MTDKAPDLLPCSFCGSDRVTVWNVAGGQQAVCKDCKATAAPGKTWEDAVGRWNTRADLAPAVKQLEWVKDAYGIIAETPFGTYYSFGYVGGNWSVSYGQLHHGKIIISGVSEKPEIAAKAAAQADFERRVRECLA